MIGRASASEAVATERQSEGKSGDDVTTVKRHVGYFMTNEEVEGLDGGVLQTTPTMAAAGLWW